VRVFVDSNIPMYVAGAPHPNREPATRFMERVREGEIAACTSTEVLQEILYRYSALGRLDLAGRVYDLFVQIVPEIFDVTLGDTDVARDLITSTGGISARDAVHAAVMINREVDTIATFDRGFERLGRLSLHQLT
jgi:predicted nucleic acid-binding protein